MTDQKQPWAMADEDLDGATGGMTILTTNENLTRDMLRTTADGGSAEGDTKVSRRDTGQTFTTCGCSHL